MKVYIPGDSLNGLTDAYEKYGKGCNTKAGCEKQSAKMADAFKKYENAEQFLAEAINPPTPRADSARQVAKPTLHDDATERHKPLNQSYCT